MISVWSKCYAIVFQGCFYSISNPGSREQQVFEDADLSRLRGSPGNRPADDNGAGGELFSLFFLTVLKKWEIACCLFSCRRMDREMDGEWEIFQRLVSVII